MMVLLVNVDVAYPTKSDVDTVRPAVVAAAAAVGPTVGPNALVCQIAATVVVLGQLIQPRRILDGEAGPDGGRQQADQIQVLPRRNNL